MKNLKITGLVETYLTDKKGVKRKVGSHHNTVAAEFHNKLAKYLTSHASYDLIEFSNMFTGGTGYAYSQVGGDGIVGSYDSGVQPAFASVASQPAANQFRVTGTWTNPLGTSYNMANPGLGVNWIKQQGWEAPGDGGFFSDFLLASGGMTTTAVPSGELITIVWTITFTVH